MYIYRDEVPKKDFGAAAGAENYVFWSSSGTENAYSVAGVEQKYNRFVAVISASQSK